MMNIVKKYLNENYARFNVEVKVNNRRGIVMLCGECDCWQTVVDIGHGVASLPGVKSVVNDITITGVILPKKNYSSLIKKGTEIGVIDNADVVVIGAGITGCGVARELSKYQLKIIVVEKEDDVANGATKANNGDIHSGYLETPGTLKAKLNVKGNAMYDNWAQELHFDFIRRGNLLVIFDETFRSDLESAMERAHENGVDCFIIDGEKVLEMEPLMASSNKKPVAALYVPSMGIVEPWQVAIALAENAVDNGVKIILDCTVCSVLHDNGEIKGVVTEKGIINAPYVINCAGVYADEISEMAGDHCYTIHPRKGTIAIIDKNLPAYTRPVKIIDAERPLHNNKHTKGGGMATTIAGNNLLGPSATEIPDKEDMETSYEDLSVAMACSSICEIGYHNVIRFFSGTRPATYTEDFFIEMSPVTHGFINVGGIQSPGLASAPAVAEYAISILLDDMDKLGKKPGKNKNFNPIRKAKVKFADLTLKEKDELISQRPEYGHIVCRCETITEGEILDALRSPVIPTSVDAIKRRVRAGMGRCQGGFCQPRVLEIIARELGKDWTEITLKGQGSNILMTSNRN